MAPNKGVVQLFTRDALQSDRCSGSADLRCSQPVPRRVVPAASEAAAAATGMKRGSNVAAGTVLLLRELFFEKRFWSRLLCSHASCSR